MKRALVLGGGGVVGVAWETALIQGLREGGVDVGEADVVVGTSAGSMVGTRVAAGHDLDLAEPRDAERDSIEIPLPEGGFDMDQMNQVFALWSGAEEMTDALCAEIGALARSSRTASQDAWVASTGGSLGVHDWPETELRICAVDVDTGEFVVHTRRSGAPLHRAIASSCAIPSMFPPIEISERHYMDGGVRSGTSADVVLDAAIDVALVIAPICAATAVFGALAERSMNAEAEQLRAGGARVCCVIPGEHEVAAFGPSLMDPARVAASAEAGYARGLELARGEAALWAE
jgi:NTE family protein